DLGGHAGLLLGAGFGLRRGRGLRSARRRDGRRRGLWLGSGLAGLRAVVLQEGEHARVRHRRDPVKHRLLSDGAERLEARLEAVKLLGGGADAGESFAGELHHCTVPSVGGCSPTGSSGVASAGLASAGMAGSGSPGWVTSPVSALTAGPWPASGWSVTTSPGTSTGTLSGSLPVWRS